VQTDNYRHGKSFDTNDNLFDFLDFGLNYVDTLKGRFWDLEPGSKQHCLDLLFPGGVGIQKNKKVYTPQISPIYSLGIPSGQAKSDPKAASKSQMVELVGTAPTSAGLSWLAVYRFSPSEKSRGPADERTKSRFAKSEVLASIMDRNA